MRTIIYELKKMKLSLFEKAVLVLFAADITSDIALWITNRIQGGF